MNIRNATAVVGLLVLALAPFTAHADRADRATDACIRAFIDAYVSKDQTVRVQKALWSSNSLDFYARQYTIELNAHRTGTKEQLAQARCVANRKGEVLNMKGAQVETSDVQ